MSTFEVRSEADSGLQGTWINCPFEAHAFDGLDIKSSGQILTNTYAHGSNGMYRIKFIPDYGVDALGHMGSVTPGILDILLIGSQVRFTQHI